ncbi:MAG: glycosyltransferase family 1 protein [Rhodocyclaceae bacterium]|nr:MAG: glycosyltransferase family 1 protein [Rhodocyclaceae bacterium]
MTECQADAASLKVLYLHHVAPFGGSSRSMMEMINALPSGTVEARIVLPRGQYAEILGRQGLLLLTSGGVAQFDHCRYSYYRGWRWLVLGRELLYLPGTLFALWRARRRWPDTDLVHVNEITMLPSLLAARWLFGKPVVVHVRSVQCTLPLARTHWVFGLVGRYSAMRIAIDQNVQQSLPADLSSTVIHNGLKVPDGGGPTGDVCPGELVVGMVGVIARVKGCIEFVRAAAELKRRGVPVRFKLIGKEIRHQSGWRDRLLRSLGFSQEISNELLDIIAAEGLEDIVRFEPFTTDLKAVYRAMDVIAFPSHYDAPGRPIFEAALYGIPAIAAVSEPMPDTIQPEVTGLTIPPRDHLALADAIERLYRDPQLRRTMGDQARAFAEGSFDAARNASEVLALYRRLKAGED